MALIRIEHVTKDYTLGEQQVRALHDVTLNIEAGVLLAIAGPSGSGKTTLLNLIGCIDNPTSGRITVAGNDVSLHTPDELAALRASTIGFVFQTFNLLPVLSAEENIEYPLLQNHHLTAMQRRERVARYLRLVGLADFAKHRPNQLSGGQRQRVAIARALVINPKIVLADEPTANLDRNTGAEILKLMQYLNRKLQTTFVFSTHDKQVVSLCNRLVHIEDGRVVALGIRRDGRWSLMRPRARSLQN